MGRKKKRDKQIIFCYYCDRIYENERVLIQHQRAKHFKCPQCHKRISTAQGMMVHMFQVHKETIEHVPGAKEGRDSFEVEIFGMDGVPAEVVEEKRIKVFGEAAKKKPKTNPQPQQLQPIVQPQAHEIKIPGTRNVFSIGPPRTPGVNPMMMMGMPGMPMFPGMPFPGIPQVLPPPMPLPVPALQIRPPTIPPPGAIPVPHMGGPLLVPPPTRIIAPPPSVPPPKIAPPPVESLPEFPNIPPPQFTNITLPSVGHPPPNAPPPKLALVEAPELSKNGISTMTPSDQAGAKSPKKDSKENIPKLPKDNTGESPKKGKPLKDMTNQLNDSESQASQPIVPTPSTQSHLSAQSGTLGHQNAPELANKVSKRTFEPPPSISTSQDRLATSRSPMNPRNAPGVPPPKMVPSPAKPPANPAMVPNAVTKTPVHQVGQLLTTMQPQPPIRYRRPAPGTRKGRSPIIPVHTALTGQPVGRYVPQVMGANSPPTVPPPTVPPPTVPPPQLTQAPPIAVGADKVASPKKKKGTIRIYNEKDVSQEEKRAMHPKYSGHLTKRIDSLSESIEERLKLLK